MASHNPTLDLDTILSRLSTPELVPVFQEAWLLADSRGMGGHRTESGLDAVIAHVLSEPLDDDPDQLTLFDCD